MNVNQIFWSIALVITGKIPMAIVLGKVEGGVGDFHLFFEPNEPLGLWGSAEVIRTLQRSDIVSEHPFVSFTILRSIVLLDKGFPFAFIGPYHNSMAQLLR